MYSAIGAAYFPGAISFLKLHSFQFKNWNRASLFSLFIVHAVGKCCLNIVGFSGIRARTQSALIQETSYRLTTAFQYLSSLTTSLMLFESSSLVLPHYLSSAWYMLPHHAIKHRTWMQRNLVRVGTVYSHNFSCVHVVYFVNDNAAANGPPRAAPPPSPSRLDEFHTGFDW